MSFSAPNDLLANQRPIRASVDLLSGAIRVAEKINQPIRKWVDLPVMDNDAINSRPFTYRYPGSNVAPPSTKRMITPHHG
jgi:fructose-1,6-bisphosphatase